MAWTLALLQTNPAALARAHNEVDALGGRLVNYQDLDQLPYLRACLDEGLRLQAPPGCCARPSKTTRSAGILTPRTPRPGLPLRAAPEHRGFGQRPSGSTPTVPDRHRQPQRVHPFNTGPRKCLGYRLAYIDGVMTLATILARYTLGAPFRLDPQTQDADLNQTRQQVCRPPDCPVAVLHAIARLARAAPKRILGCAALLTISASGAHRRPGRHGAEQRRPIRSRPPIRARGHPDGRKVRPDPTTILITLNSPAGITDGPARDIRRPGRGLRALTPRHLSGVAMDRAAPPPRQA